MILQRFFILFISCRCFISGTKLEEYLMKENDTWVHQNLAQCLLEVTKISFFKDRDVIVLLREYSYDDASLIAMNYPIVIVTEDDVSERLHHARNRAIAYIFTKISIPEILSTISYDARTKFIVLCSTKEEAENIFSQFWEKRGVNVIALLYNKRNTQIKLLTFFPYTDYHCDIGNRSALLTTWSPTTPILVPLFPPKVANFRKCPLYVTLLERPPSVMIADNGTITGVEILIMEEVAKSINATPVFQFLHGKNTKYKSKDKNILMLELTENHSHAVAGSLLLTTSVSPVSEGISYLRTTCLSIAVPKNNEQPYLYIFTTLLPGKYFLILISATILYFISFYLIYKVKDRKILFSTTCSMLVQPLISGSRIEIKYIITRFFFTTWIFSAFVFGKVFEASISSSVLAPDPSPQLENLEDVLQTKLTLRGENFMMKEVLPRHLPKVYKANIDWVSIDEGLAMEMMSENKTSAYLGLKNNLRFIWKNKKLEDKIYIQEECVLRYPPVIQVRKNSPLYWVFTRIIQVLGQSGLVSKYFTTVMVTYFDEKPIQKIANDVKPLNLTQISGAFAVLTLGLGVSFIAFMFEVVPHYLKQRNSKIKWKFC